MFMEKKQKMKNHDIFARSFNQHDQKRFGYSAIVGCFIVTWCLCTVLKPYFGHLYVLNLRMVDELKLVIVNGIPTEPKPSYVQRMETELFCNTSARRSDTCEMKGDVRIQGNSSTIYVFTPNAKNASWIIRPYARKGDNGAMENITTFTIKSVQNQAKTMPKCTQFHNVPAVVFSIGGYSGNSFHSFSDIILPLYATSRKFSREVQFLVVNKISRWNIKFKEVLDQLSRFEVINIDHEKEVHCFPSMIVGLRKDDRKELYVDSMIDFTKFLRSSYSLERSTAIKLTRNSTRSPRLLIISRKKTRAFTNVNDVVLAAKELGFEVIVTEMSPNMTQVSRLVNSCDVMMGVHGAGLTNMVFLPENAVVIQVVPLGNMNWMAKTFYEEPSKAMRLKHLEYKIREEESTLIDQYPLSHQVFKDPSSIQRKGWEAYKSVYMDKQNVKVDIIRFREIFSKALELLH